MPRKKTTITQPLYLSADVVVTITAPKDKWPTIQWNGGVVTVSVRGAAAPRPTLTDYAESNGPTYDTPAIKAAQKKLRPFTTADAFREAGLDGDGVSPEALESLADAFGGGN